MNRGTYNFPKNRTYEALLSASWAAISVSSSYALTASYALNGGGGSPIDTSSFATTGSNTFIGNQIVSGAVIATGEYITSTFYKVNGENGTLTYIGDDGGDGVMYINAYDLTGSLNINVGSFYKVFDENATKSTQILFYQPPSGISIYFPSSSGTLTTKVNGTGSGHGGNITLTTIPTSSYVNPLNQNVIITGSLTVSGSSTFTNIGPTVLSGSVTTTDGFTGSLQGTSSWAINALTSSYVNPLNQSVIISGSTTIRSALATGTAFQVISGSSPILYAGTNISQTRVGIRTSTPLYSFDVNGNANFTPEEHSGYLRISPGQSSTWNNPTFFQTSFGSTLMLNNAYYTASSGQFIRVVNGYAAGIQLEPSLGGIELFTAPYGTAGTSFASFTSRISITNSGSVGINNTSPSYSLDVSGSGRFLNGLIVTSSLNAPNITGSLQGTASWATNFISASFYVLNSATSSFVTNAQTSSFVTNSQTSSFVQNNQTSSFSTGSFTGSFTGSLQGTASWATNFVSAPNYVLNSATSSFVTNAQTSSFTQIATGSLTASVVPTQFSIISGSITEFIVTGTGIAIGSAITDTHRITGSLLTSGSTVTFTPSLIATANSQSYYLITGSVTQQTALSNQIYGVNISPNIVFTSGSQTNTAFRVSPRFSGSAAFTSSQTNIIADFGATGVGSQLVITDVTSGSVFNVNNISGLPIIEATSDGTVNLYNYPTKVLQKTGSAIIISGSLNISGSISVSTGSLTLTSGSITMPNRPAFRVTGAGGAKVAVTALSGSYLNVDYQQGSGWDNANGLFTAPIAGLYQVNVVVRTNSNSLGTISQLIVYKNNTGGTTGTPQIMIEFGTNTTMNHTGGSTISKLAVGDTLRMVVASGEISFDQNDNFSVAYIG